MKRGSISVFLALILPLVLILLFTLIESARISGIRVAVRDSGDAAINSVFGAYNRTLFDEYGLLFFDGGYGNGLIDYEAIEKEFSDAFSANKNNGSLFFGGTLLPFGLVDATVTDVVTATDYNGEILIRSALDYFKFDLAGELVESIESCLKGAEEGNKAKAQSDADSSQLQSTDWGAADLDMSTIGSLGRTEYAVLIQNEAEEGEEEEPGPPPIDDGKLKSDLSDSVVGSAERSKATGWLSLVVPSEVTVSGYQFSADNLPSRCAVDPRPLSDQSEFLTDAAKKVTFCEYLLRNFTNYSNESGGEGPAYQVEYILFGNQNDRKNFETALNRIMWIREGMNIVHLLTSDKFDLIEVAADALVGWTGNALIIGLTCTALMAAWAYAESILDVRALLQKKKVPFFKTEETWVLSFEGIANLLEGGGEAVKDDPTGMSYEDYLRMFLYVSDFHQDAYRAMDLIQDKLQKRAPNFLMTAAIYGMEVRVTVGARELFTALPLVRKKKVTGLGYYWTEQFSEVY